MSQSDELYREKLLRYLSAMRPPTPFAQGEMLGLEVQEIAPYVYQFEGSVSYEDRAWLERMRYPGNSYRFVSP